MSVYTTTPKNKMKYPADAVSIYSIWHCFVVKQTDEDCVLHRFVIMTQLLCGNSDIDICHY